MGCGCAARRAKMKAWVKKQQAKRIAAKKAKQEQQEKEKQTNVQK